MTGTAAAAGVTDARDFGDSVESSRRNLVFNRAFRNEEARANKRFIARPLVAHRIAKLANRSQEGVARKFWTVFAAGFKVGKVSPECITILPDDGGFGSRDI